MATRLCLPVRRCFRGLVDSVKEEAGLAASGAWSGVDGRESFDLTWDEERRFGAIVVEPGLEKLQHLGYAGLAQRTMEVILFI